MLEARWFALADRLAVSESRRRGLRPDEADAFRSFIRQRLAERGETILAAHDGRSSLSTYLVVVVARTFHDWRRTQWGDWRPSSEALRLGTLAVELDRRMSLAGERFETAAAEIRSRFGRRASRQQLEAIQRRLPGRTRPNFVGPDALSDRSAASHPTDELLNARERDELTRRLSPLVRTALAGLDATDRLVLLLVLRQGLRVRAAARAVGLEYKKVGRSLERTLTHLRTAMAAAGVDRHEALLLLEGEGEGEGCLEPVEEIGREYAAPRPSNQEAES